MNNRFENFPWPKPAPFTETPVWDGRAFVIGSERRRVLQFETGQSNWTPELTRFHEEEAGANHPIDRASRRLAIDSLKQLSQDPTPVILDVGCSSGYVLENVRRELPAARLIGSDYLAAPLAEFAKRMPDVPLLQFDLRRCPLPDSCVDAVTALNVLEHIDEDERALAEIHRVLRPRGLVHLEVPAGSRLYDIYDEQLLHHRRYDVRDFVALVRRVGFTVVKATHLGFFLLPAFIWRKSRNQRLRDLPDEAKRALVAEQIRSSQQSTLLAACLSLEQAIGRVISYPRGIRCVVIARREASS